MNINAYSWVGVATKDFHGAVHFFTEVVGLSLAHKNDKHALFRLPSGQDFELFSSRSRWYALQTRPVVGFEAADLPAARRVLEAQGVEFVSDIVEASGWGMFCYFRGPDDSLYELIQRYPLDNIPNKKTVLGYSWVRLWTIDFTRTIQFFDEVMGLRLESHDTVDETALFRLPSRQVFEIFGPRRVKPEYRYMRGACIGFEVVSVRKVHLDMISKGMNFISEIERTPGGTTVIYFRGPDDQLYAFQQRAN